MTRQSDHSLLNPQFIERWSPRSFDESTELTEQQVGSLFEAARWAPSCFNEQPWRWVWARRDEDKARFTDLLAGPNREWASRASVLAVLFTKRTFERNDKPNRHAEFDAGAAWMSLALQARHLGLATHAMAGYDREASYAAAGLSEEGFSSVCMIAIGKPGSPDVLPEGLKEKEKPNARKPFEEIVKEGRWN